MAGKSSHLVVFGKGLVNTAVQRLTQPNTEQLTAVRVAVLFTPLAILGTLSFLPGSHDGVGCLLLTINPSQATALSLQKHKPSRSQCLFGGLALLL